jgi:hypothetical protein
VRVDENREGGGAENSQDCLTTNAKPVLRIRDVNPGSEFFHPGSRVKKIPNPISGPTSKNLSIFNPKKLFQVLGNMIRDVHPGSGSRILIFYPSWIPDAVVKKASDPGLNPQPCAKHTR